MMPHTDTLEIVTSSQRYHNRIFNEIHNTLKTQSQINIRATLQPTKRRTNSLALHYKLYKLVPQKSKTTMNFTKPYKQSSTRLLNTIQPQTTSYQYFLQTHTCISLNSKPFWRCDIHPWSPKTTVPNEPIWLTSSKVDHPGSNPAL